jgi:hypothetical protein
MELRGARLSGNPQQRRPIHPALGIVPACLIAGLLLAPALFAGFYGDDFSLWHEGRRLIAEPSKFFVGPSNFYRPANSWLFALHYLLFDTDPVGYHAGTLLMHLGCGALIGYLVSRFVDSAWYVFAAASIWMCSPYAFEPVQYVNVAYNDLTVLLAWLGIAALWPGPGRTFGRGRLGAICALASFSVFCKESWVILPGLVAAFELWIARARPWRVVRTTALSAVPVAVYLVLYARLFPGRGGYYEYGAWVLAKVPHYWSAFMMLTPVDASRASFGPAESAALLTMIGCAVVGWRRRDGLIGVGFAFLFCTMAPILFIPFNPSRYTAAPLVGFVLAMTGTIHALLAWTPARRRRLALVASGAAVAAVFVSGLFLLRGDVADMQRLRTPHAELVEEIRTFAPHLPIDRPIVCVRMERIDPLGSLDREGSLGLPKLYFKRTETPYALADWAQLFTYGRDGLGDEIWADMTPRQASGREYAIVAHLAGRFALLEPSADDLTAELARLSRSGHATRIVGPWPPATGGSIVATSNPD